MRNAPTFAHLLIGNLPKSGSGRNRSFQTQSLPGWLPRSSLGRDRIVVPIAVQSVWLNTSPSNYIHPQTMQYIPHTLTHQRLHNTLDNKSEHRHTHTHVRETRFLKCSKNGCECLKTTLLPAAIRGGTRWKQDYMTSGFVARTRFNKQQSPS